MSASPRRHAVVTGGSQGIGLAVVQRLLAEGCRAHILDLEPGPDAAYADAIAAGAEFHRLDVTDAEAVDATMKALPGVDVLVTCAGVAGSNAPTWDYSVDEWRRIHDVNLNGTFYCLRAAAPQMIEQGYGRIVTIASVAGKEGNPNAAAYSASKAGVIALTKSLGKELASHDIAVNCVTPSAARTRIFDQMTDDHIAYMLSRVPRGRFVKVEEIAALVSWLASEDCSFSTGAVFDISGGRATY